MLRAVVGRIEEPFAGRCVAAFRLALLLLLLEHTSMTPDGIAESCHFCDASYLVRVFMRTLGRAPSDFRPTFK